MHFALVQKKTMFGSTLLFISLCEGKGSLGWPQAEIAHSALLYEVSDSIGIRSEFPARTIGSSKGEGSCRSRAVGRGK